MDVLTILQIEKLRRKPKWLRLKKLSGNITVLLLILLTFKSNSFGKEGTQFIEKKLIELKVATEKTPKGLLVQFELKEEWMINQATLSLRCPRGIRTVNFNTKARNSILIKNQLSRIEYFAIEACSLRISLRGRSQDRELRNPYDVLIPID